MVPQGRIELPTPGFSVLCSTNWATEAHFKWRFRRDSNPRSPVWQTDMLTNYTTEPLLVAGEGFEPTTSGLWARRDMAEKEGFEPPRDFHPLSVFKTDPFNRAWVFLRIAIINYIKFNGGPGRTRTCDQPVMSRWLWPTELRVQILVAAEGFEPPT